MQIGDILYKARTQNSNPSHKKLGLVELSEQCGISYGQIARLEKNIYQPRVLTLVKISEALGLSLQQIVRELQFKQSIQKKWVVRREYRTPFNMEPSDFMKLLEDNNNKRQLLEHVISQFAAAGTFEVPDEEPAERIFKASVSHLLRAVANDYPEQVVKFISSEFAQGGLITLDNLSCYIAAARIMQNISQWELGKSLQVEYRLVQRLENAEIQLVDWDLMVKLDEALELRGAAIGLAWAVSEFESGIFLKKSSRQDAYEAWSPENRDALELLTLLVHLGMISTSSNISVDFEKSQILQRTSEEVKKHRQVRRKTNKLQSVPRNLEPYDE